MRFLVTRPQPDCKSTADLLRAEGHVADEMPLLEMKAELPVRFDLERISALAFTSRRAVALMAGHAQAADLKKLPVFAVGGATAKICEEAGFLSVLPAQNSVQSLGQLILNNHHDLAIGHVLYPAAKERAGDLEGILGAENLSCDTVDIYRMEPKEGLPDTVLAPLTDGTYDGVLIFSRRTAETLLSLIKNNGLEHILSGLSVYAISRQAAEPLSRYVKVRVADHACQQSLLDLALADC